MQDAGRLFVSIDWLINHVKELAYFKMNKFHIHGMENQNYRLESKSHPEIVAPQHWTNDQVNQLIAVAKEYFVDLIFELETPSHANAIISKHPELGIVDVNGHINSDALDITNPAVYTFVEQLLNETLTLFSTSKYFHIGGDEFPPYSQYPQLLKFAQTKWGPNSNAQDVFLYWINWVAGIVQKANKTAVVWNDNKGNGGVFSVDKKIVMDAWGWTGINQLESGYQVINSFQTALYPTCNYEFLSFFLLFFLFYYLAYCFFSFFFICERNCMCVLFFRVRSIQCVSTVASRIVFQLECESMVYPWCFQSAD